MPAGTGAATGAGSTAGACVAELTWLLVPGAAALLLVMSPVPVDSPPHAVMAQHATTAADTEIVRQSVMARSVAQLPRVPGASLPIETSIPKYPFW